MPWKDIEKRRAYQRNKWARIRLDDQLRKKHYGNRQGRRRAEHLKARYGLSLEQWEAIFEAQGRCCAICGSKTPGWNRGWHTDHDHLTNKIRGILCHFCNRTVGNYDIGHFQKFIDYLVLTESKPQPPG